jgi:hypothetical protein
MIFVKSTLNNTGITIYGDKIDYEELYEALHTVVGQENEFKGFESSRLRVLGVCYDLRHALMGDREIEFIENGMNKEIMKGMSIITPETNVYLKINVLWPEILFITMALNDFVRLYGKKKAKSRYDYLMDKHNIWDEAIAITRVFQTSIKRCIKETVAEKTFSRMMNLMYNEYTWLSYYMTQYLDILNCKFIGMDNEARLKSLPIMVKRLTEQDEEYRQLEEAVKEAAFEYKCPIGDITPNVEYPENIEW